MERRIKQGTCAMAKSWHCGAALWLGLRYSVNDCTRISIVVSRKLHSFPSNQVVEKISNRYQPSIFPKHPFAIKIQYIDVHLAFIVSARHATGQVAGARRHIRSSQRASGI